MGRDMNIKARLILMALAIIGTGVVLSSRGVPLIQVVIAAAATVVMLALIMWAALKLRGERKE